MGVRFGMGVKELEATLCDSRAGYKCKGASLMSNLCERMQELMCQICTTLRQHKWAEPFMEPVDVKGLRLDDYYEVIEKTIDFTTIKNKMEEKDGSSNNHVQEICEDIMTRYAERKCYTVLMTTKDHKITHK
ncbi:Transcription factor GTE6 [Capsicum chinense]|nr:Transcription factor GTE6 [Capsicum chinense]